MAHNLMYSENLKRYAAMFANNIAWHGLGIVVSGTKNWKETIDLAGLNWTVGKYQLEFKGKEIPAWGIFKQDINGDPTDFLSSVGARYTPIQNEFCFHFVNTLMEEEGCHYESAGALGNGERIWCLAKIPMDFEINNGDKHQTYLLFTTSHDGSLSAQCRLTTVRVVCQNTLNMAVNLNGDFVKVKHTKDAEKKLEAAKQLISNTQQTTDSLKDKLQTLSERIISKEHYLDVLNKLFPPSEDPNANNTRRNNTLLEITKLFESNDGDTFPEERGTAVNLFNAVTEYTDHFRSTRRHKRQSEDAARCESALFGGSGDILKQNALDVILKSTEDAKVKVRPIYSTPINNNNMRHALFSKECPSCKSPVFTQKSRGLSWEFFCENCQRSI